MRKYKFRGKRVDNDEWVYGDLLYIAGGCVIYFGSPTDTVEPDIEKSSPVAVELYNDECAVVVPDTIGQFTGLPDKNGKEIYVGDILGCPEDDYFLNEAVIFAEGCFMVKDDYTTTPMCAIDTQYRTIIGNIHDNPELLKGASNE